MFCSTFGAAIAVPLATDVTLADPDENGGETVGHSFLSIAFLQVPLMIEKWFLWNEKENGLLLTQHLESLLSLLNNPRLHSKSSESSNLWVKWVSMRRKIHFYVPRATFLQDKRSNSRTWWWHMFGTCPVNPFQNTTCPHHIMSNTENTAHRWRFDMSGYLV